MKCTENCPAFWVQGGGGYEYPDEVDCYGCQIYGMDRGCEGDHCNLKKNQIEKMLGELEAYEMGKIDRPKWVAMRFIHDMDGAGDRGLPQFPPKRCVVRKIESGDLEEPYYYCTNMKSIHGDSDLYFAQSNAYQKGYEDAKEGKAIDCYYPKRKEDFEQKEDIFDF